MSNDSSPSDGQSSEADTTVSTNGMAQIERTFLRLTFWQTLLSLAGVFTGAVALYAALNESQAVRDQTAASVWPYVQIIINDTDDGENARFALSLENVGVGPARMQGVALSFGDKTVGSWDEATRFLLDKTARVGVDYGRASISRRVIGPGETVIAFQTKDRALSLAMQEAVYSGQAALRFCFCSIFDQCWLSRMIPESEAAGPIPVEVCPDFGDAAFLN